MPRSGMPFRIEAHMIDLDLFLHTLQEHHVSFFTGVPDSYLNDFCLKLLNEVPAGRHVITANEGNAVALASGFYFADGCLPLVYMQNSGIGNALNPLVSLCDPNVYSVPMVLLIGWRGQPGTGDHPQHQTQGEITTKLLEDMHIPFRILDETSACEDAVWASELASINKQPVALIAPKNMLTAKEKKIPMPEGDTLSREDAIRILLDLAPNAVFSATTGRAARELYALREDRGEDHGHDFLNVGSMGHASSVACGIALAKSDRNVICLDGDGAAIMHMGSWTTNGKLGLKNLLHVVLNNGVHESVGGQPTAGRMISFTDAARACGYDAVGPVETENSLRAAFYALKERTKPGFIDIWVKPGLRPGLPPLKPDHHKIINELISELRVDRKG